MNNPDFEMLKSLSDEELGQALDLLVKQHLRKVQTLFEEGDMGYIRFAYERLMRDHVAFEELLLDRMKQIAKREDSWNPRTRKDEKNSSDPE
jgi:LPS sulfotransferase NodH